MRSVPDTRRLPFALACFLLAGLAARPSFAQAPEPSRLEQLLAGLAASEEERRVDAAVNLGALFTLSPGKATQPAIAALGQTLENDASPLVRALAARALELAGEPSAIPALLSALGREREVAARKAIIYALARHRDPQITAALIPLLKNKNREVRGTAAYALAEVADPASANALVEVLAARRKDEDAFARSQAARALGRIRAAGAVRPLADALAGDKALAVRREAARALGRIGRRQDGSVIGALRAATLAADPYLSREAAAALAEINEGER